MIASLFVDCEDCMCKPLMLLNQIPATLHRVGRIDIRRRRHVPTHAQPSNHPKHVPKLDVRYPCPSKIKLKAQRDAGALLFWAPTVDGKEGINQTRSGVPRNQACKECLTNTRQYRAKHAKVHRQASRAAELEDFVMVSVARTKVDAVTVTVHWAGEAKGR